MVVRYEKIIYWRDWRIICFYETFQKKNYEVYRANSKIQKGLDLVVILENNVVKRIQVKTTILENKSNNNAVKLTEGFDYLVLVVINESEELNYYILSNNEVQTIQNGSKLLAITEKTNGKKSARKHCK